MDQLISNVALFEENNLGNNIKDIQFKLHEFIHWKEKDMQTNIYYTLSYRLTHKLIKKNIDLLILTFKNIEKQHGRIIAIIFRLFWKVWDVNFIILFLMKI